MSHHEEKQEQALQLQFKNTSTLLCFCDRTRNRQFSVRRNNNNDKELQMLIFLVDSGCQQCDHAAALVKHETFCMLLCLFNPLHGCLAHVCAFDLLVLDSSNFH
jgi:hypothetical protein